MKTAPGGVKIATMTCEKCKKKPATFHLTAIENGQKREAHPCEDCARETGVMNVKLNFSMSSSRLKTSCSVPSFQPRLAIKLTMASGK